MSTPVAPPRAKPGRRRRLVAGTVAAITAEVVLYDVYLRGDGAFHWFTHFFAGVSAALVVMSAVALYRHRAVRVPLLWMIVGHLAAMGPDVLFVQEMAHRRWMDVFVAHNVSHFIPGRNLTWYLIFLGCLAVYLWILETSTATAVTPHGGFGGNA